jgi:hypothetical protein
MRTLLPALVLTVAALTLRPLDAAPYFENIDTGARAQGMGNAGAAMIEDVTAFDWNPAALDRLDRPEAMAGYGMPLGVRDLYTGALAVGGRGPGPLRGLGMAVAWRRYGVEGVYSEDLWQVSAGRTLRRFGSGHELAVGGAFKIGRVGLTGYPDPVTGSPVEYGARTAWSLDTSALWRSPWRLDVGWVAQDWPTPEYDFIPGGEGSAVPTRHRLSAAYRWHRESTVGAAWTSAGTRGGSRLDLGVEIWFFDVFAIRSALTDLGGLPDPGTSAQRFQYAGGVGLRNERWRVDAAVATTRELGTSYRFSLVVPFGSRRADSPAGAESRP